MTYLKLKNREPLTPDPPFVGNVLRDIFAAAYGNRRVLPDDAWFRKWSGILNHAHAWLYAAQEDRNYQRDIIATEKARVAYLRQLQKIRGREPWVRLRLDPLPHADTHGRTYDRYIAEVSYHQHLLIEPPKVDDWRWMMDVLPDAIDQGMREVNPDYPIGQAKGETAEVIAAITLPLAGLRVTPVAVSTQLQKKRRPTGRD